MILIYCVRWNICQYLLVAVTVVCIVIFLSCFVDMKSLGSKGPESGFFMIRYYESDITYCLNEILIHRTLKTTSLSNGINNVANRLKKSDRKQLHSEYMSSKVLHVTYQQVNEKPGLPMDRLKYFCCSSV